MTRSGNHVMIPLQRSDDGCAAGGVPAEGAPIIAAFGPAIGGPHTVGWAAFGGICCGGAAVLCSVLPEGRGAAVGLALLGALFGAIELRRIRRHGGARRGLAGASLGIALLVCVGVLASQVAFASAGDRRLPLAPVASDRTDAPPLAEDISVRIGTATLGTSADGIAQFSLAFTVTNRGDRASSVAIDFDALGPRGRVITRDSAYVADLAAGQSAASSAFNIVSAKLAPTLKEATFRVGRVGRVGGFE